VEKIIIELNIKGDIMCVVRQVCSADGSKVAGYMFMCPACNQYHVAWVDRCQCDVQFLEPTFSSVLIEYRNGERCHSTVTKGKIHFLNDCTHNLKGQTTYLPYLEEHNQEDLHEE
jgi:hypothetical protein